jgi:hypothetical protein
MRAVSQSRIDADAAAHARARRIGHEWCPVLNPSS